MAREIPHTLREEHDAHMAQPAVEYRRYRIAPQSHLAQPYYDKGAFTYWGYVVTGTGDRTIINEMPGATWFHTADDARHGIDCLYESGGVGANADDHSWVQKFWELVRARCSTPHADTRSEAQRELEGDSERFHPAHFGD